MKKIIIWIVVIIIVLGGFFWWQSQKNKPAVNLTGEPIKVGSILILSGEGASWGEAARNGIDLAIEKVNADGGIDGRPLHAIHEDDGSDPKKAVSAFNKLTNTDGVQFIVGPNWSNTGAALIDLIKQKKVVTISPSLGIKEFNEASPFILNTWPHDYLLSEDLAQYVYDKGYRNVALFGANQVWIKEQSNAFSSKFKSLGGKIGFLYEPLPTETDVRTQVTKVKNDPKIDAIIMTTDGYGLTSIVEKRIREFDIKLPIFSITIDRQVIKNCDGSCEGMTFLTFLTPTPDFEKKYRAKYDREVEIGADSAYDAVMLLAQAFKATKSTDPTKVQEYLHGIKNYSGASGSLVSDGRGAFTKPYQIKQVKNAEPVTISN